MYPFFLRKMERRRGLNSLIVCSVLVSGSIVLTALVFLTKPSLGKKCSSYSNGGILVITVVLKHKGLTH